MHLYYDSSYQQRNGLVASVTTISHINLNVTSAQSAQPERLRRDSEDKLTFQAEWGRGVLANVESTQCTTEFGLLSGERFIAIEDSGGGRESDGFCSSRGWVFLD